MQSLPTLRRVWLAPELPGYREHPEEHATYSALACDSLPPVMRDLDHGFAWLLAEPTVSPSLAEADPAAARPASRRQLKALVDETTGGLLPRSFVAFIESEAARTRIRSCTDCYLDLADFPVPVQGGGTLIHFLSDSQWVLHWLVYVGPDGAEAVVVTDRPLGFELVEDDQEEPMRLFDPSGDAAAVCAETFSEFVYRFWIENEIWFSLASRDNEPHPLSGEARDYAEHYKRGGSS